MNSYKMVETALNGLLKTLSTPCLVGPHGIGKTSFVKDYAARHGYEFVSFRLGQCSDVGDILGRMVESDGRSAYLPPEVFPRTNKPVLLFLDEINRTTKDLLQYIFEVIEPTEPKRLGSYVLPAGSRVVCAMNPDTADYQVNGFDDAAFWSRLVKLDVMPTNDEFLQFVPEGEVKKFFNAHRELISDRRAITQFAIAHKAGLAEATAIIAESMLGGSTGKLFVAFMADEQQKSFTLDDILAGKLPKKLSLSDKMQVCNVLRDAVQNGRCVWNKEECASLKKFFMSLDKEAFFTLAKDIEAGSPLFTAHLYDDAELKKKFGNYV